MMDSLRAEIRRLREAAAPLEPDSAGRRQLGSQALDHALAFLDGVEEAPSLTPASEVFAKRLDPEFPEQGRDASAVLEYVGACVEAISSASSLASRSVPGTSIGSTPMRCATSRHRCM